MKNVLAYVITGILLGVTVSFIPLGLLFLQSKSTETASTLEFSQLRIQTSTFTEFEENIKFMGLPAFPSSLIYAVLLFVPSLILALGVYILSKRRMVT